MIQPGPAAPSNGPGGQCRYGWGWVYGCPHSYISPHFRACGLHVQVGGSGAVWGEGLRAGGRVLGGEGSSPPHPPAEGTPKIFKWEGRKGSHLEQHPSTPVLTHKTPGPSLSQDTTQAVPRKKKMQPGSGLLHIGQCLDFPCRERILHESAHTKTHHTGSPHTGAEPFPLLVLILNLTQGWDMLSLGLSSKGQHQSTDQHLPLYLCAQGAWCW